MPELPDSLESRQFDLNDQESCIIEKGKDHANFYANRVLMQLSNHDITLTFFQLLNRVIVGDKIKLRIEEKCSVALSIGQAVAVKDMLNRMLPDDNPHVQAALALQDKLTSPPQELKKKK